MVRVASRDPEAIGVVVACLTPGLRARIARHAPGLPGDDAWAIAVAGICVAIAEGELPRTFVASRLLDAAKRQLQRAVKLEARWRTHHQVPDLPGLDQVDEPSAALILTTAIAAGVLTEPDAWLIHATRVVGHSLNYAAAQLGIRYEAAKKRRQRAEARWAAWWAPDARGRQVGPFSVDPSHKEEIA
jgi:hypothetical protein